MDTLPERDQQPIDAWPASAINADLLSVEIPSLCEMRRSWKANTSSVQRLQEHEILF